MISSRAMVGLFVLVTLAILAWGTLQLGGFSFRRAEGYPLIAIFDSAYGVEPQTPVLVAGIKVGEVTTVELYQKRARLTLKVLRGVQVREDAVLAIKTAGLLGEKYLELDPGSDSAPTLLPGGTIRNTVNPPDFERLAEKLADISGDLKEVTASLRYAFAGPGSKESLRAIVVNLERLTTQLNEALTENRADLRATTASFKRIAAMLETRAPELIADYRRAASDVQGFVSSVSQAVDEVRPEITQSLDRVNQALAKLDAVAADLQQVTHKINRGEGTVGKLVNDEATVDKLNDALDGVNKVLGQVRDLKLFLTYRGEYRFESRPASQTLGATRGGLKSFAGLKVQPKEDKYYFFEVIDDPQGREKETRVIVRDQNGVTLSDRTTQTFVNRVKFSAQIAKRFYGITLRGGLIENTGGLGAEYAIIDPNLRIAVQAYDFSRATNPSLKAELDFVFFNHFFVTAGADDIVNNRRGPVWFGGAGLWFDDEDLKLLLATMPTP